MSNDTTPTPTPETDANSLTARVANRTGHFVLADICRAIERRAIAAEAERERLKVANGAGDSALNEAMRRNERLVADISHVAQWIERNTPDSVDASMTLIQRLERITDKLDAAEAERDAHRNVMGRIAIALYGDKNNVTDEECLIGVQAAALEISRLDKAHEAFDADIVSLLERCQKGRATCIFTAQIIENKLDTLRAENERLNELIELAKASVHACTLLGEDAHLKIKALKAGNERLKSQVLALEEGNEEIHRAFCIERDSLRQQVEALRKFATEAEEWAWEETGKVLRAPAIDAAKGGKQ